MAPTSLIPPPPGVESNFVDPPSKLGGNIALHAVLLPLVAILTLLRLFTRLRVMKVKLGVDDYLTLVNFALTVAWSGLSLKANVSGVGRHEWDMELATFSTAIKYFTIGSWLFTVLAANIRLTFLFLYLRLFGQNKKLRYVAYGGIVFVIAINLVILLSLIFRCNPVRKSWDITAPGTCVHSAIIPYLSAVASPVTDLFVFLLPLPIIVHLNMDNRKRLKLLAVFGIGLLSCIASLIRLGETPSLYASLDYTWQLSDLILWGTIEVDVGISCTCLILLPAFVEHYSNGSSHPYKTPSWISSIRLIPLRNRGSDANLKADCHKVSVDEADVSNSRPQSKPSSETLQPTEVMK